MENTEGNYNYFSSFCRFVFMGRDNTINSLTNRIPNRNHNHLEGTVKWTKGTEVIEENVTWKMEVIEVVERDHVIGYLLKGHPGDLAWYEEGKERSESVIIKVGTGLYYESKKEDLTRIKQEDFLADLVHENQLFLDVPLIPGKFFGETAQITRSDRSYCWIVDEEQYVKLQDITGVSSTEEVKLIEYYPSEDISF